MGVSVLGAAIRTPMFGAPGQPECAPNDGGNGGPPSRGCFGGDVQLSACAPPNNPGGPAVTAEGTILQTDCRGYICNDGCMENRNGECLEDLYWSAAGGDQLSDKEKEELGKKSRGEPYDATTVNAAERKIRNQEKYQGIRNKQKRQSHYGANSEAIDGADVSAAGGWVLTGVAIVACVLVCWLNPALA